MSPDKPRPLTDEEVARYWMSVGREQTSAKWVGFDDKPPRKKGSHEHSTYWGKP